MTATKGCVVSAGGGKHFDWPTPGRSFALKLLGHETGESIMLFEETLPAGTASLFHLHRDSDEVAWVLRRVHLQDPRRGHGRRARQLRIHAARRPACLEEHRQRNRPRPVSLHPGGRWRPRSGALGAPPGRRRRTQQTLPAPPLGSRRPKPPLRGTLFARGLSEESAFNS